MSRRAPLATRFFLRRLVIVTLINEGASIVRFEPTRAGREARQCDVERPQRRNGGRIDPKKMWVLTPQKAVYHRPKHRTTRERS